jgi:hypothetical protein
LRDTPESLALSSVATQGGSQDGVEPRHGTAAA